ncbi:FOG: TPR repeat [Hahella chejuensis KCTC 2396]|uniref:FOG: TPR repeat n=1 Tax=Hahella chejuensis (strain KCTC 2396) TaxID=349521 RepID=Q2SIV8_HAHCH|nr:hypothetical protein [Hahella chejuensis]ABC29416.1 FOG: TPR repeat [Hahella chejuensis KCTC 2396]
MKGDVTSTMHRMCALLLVMACLGGLVNAARAEEGADELLHREALFHYYTNDFLQSLVLLENEHVGSNHVGNQYHNLNHILAIESSLEFGLRRNAETLLEHLQFTAREAEVKQQAQMIKGRLAYRDEEWGTAVELFEGAMKGMSRDKKDEALYYMANSYLQLRRPQEAAKVLGDASKGSLWAAHGYYNLGVNYAADDPDSSRALVALRIAAAMTDDSYEGKELSDRILLAAGHIALLDKDYNKALSFLKNVHASGPGAPAAIYDYGMAFAGLGRYRTAIQSWHRAKKFALTSSGVAETFQAIAYGYEQEKLRATALDAYLEAIAVYEKEKRQIDEVVAEINEKGVLDLLLQAPLQHGEVEWYLATDLLTNTPKIAFVHYLMDKPDFFPFAKELLQMHGLLQSLRNGAQRMDIFADALEQRSRQAKRDAAGALERMRPQQLNQLVSERNALARSAAQAPDEQRALQLLALRDLDEALTRLKENFVSAQGDLSQGGNLYKTQLRKVESLQKEFSSMQRELAGKIDDYDKKLSQLAVKLLQRHWREIDGYHVRSQLALVNLYDDLAVAELRKKQPVSPEAATAGEGAL